MALDASSSKALIDNTGTLRANGGKIAVTATAAAGVVNSTINMGGIVEAFIEGDIKTSPSVQCLINPLGGVEVLSTHDQLLGGEDGRPHHYRLRSRHGKRRTLKTKEVGITVLPGDVFASRRPDPVLQQVEDFGDATISANDCFRPVSRYWDRITRPEQVLASLPAALRSMPTSRSLRRSGRKGSTICIHGG